MDLTTNRSKAYCVFQEFDKSNSGILHFANHYLAYSSKGSMRLEIDSRYLYLHPTKAAWVPAGTDVRIDIASSITCCSILFEPDFFSESHPSFQTIDLNPLMRNMILHCRRWGPDHADTDNTAQTFFSSLASVILERMKAPTTDWIPRGNTSLVSRAIDLTIERHTQALEISTVADSLATSERTLSRRMVDETGMTWANLLRRIRIIQARELLSTTNTQITTIAGDVGYTSQSAFNKAFKAETGLTPRKFRARLNHI